jgi:hypothetical protein
MINLFKKIAIFKYINKNKDKIEYKFNYDVADSTGIHDVEINHKGLVAISMHRNDRDDTAFWLEYNLRENNQPSYTLVAPFQQSFLDTLFISRMYQKMLNNYIAKNGMPNNAKSR